MYARLARYEVPADRTGEVVRGFEEAADELQALDGFEEGYVLVDDESGLAVTLVLWNTRAALEASAARSAVLRQRVIKSVAGSVVGVNEFEVALAFGDGKEQAPFQG